jgi:hypothetical protein
MPWNPEFYMQNKPKEKIVKMIDPPSGWKYGFPKVLPDDVTDNLKWLVENGYPQSEIDSFDDMFVCRHWFEAEEEVTATKMPIQAPFKLVKEKEK